MIFERRVLLYFDRDPSVGLNLREQSRFLDGAIDFSISRIHSFQRLFVVLQCRVASTFTMKPNYFLPDLDRDTLRGC